MHGPEPSSSKIEHFQPAPESTHSWQNLLFPSMQGFLQPRLHRYFDFVLTLSNQRIYFRNYERYRFPSPPPNFVSLITPSIFNVCKQVEHEWYFPTRPFSLRRSLYLRTISKTYGRDSYIHKIDIVIFLVPCARFSSPQVLSYTRKGKNGQFT